MPLALSQGYTINIANLVGRSSQPGAAEQQQAAGAAQHRRSPGDAAAQLQPGPQEMPGCTPPASVLGTPYLAQQGPCLVVGATRDLSFTPEQALRECGRAPSPAEAEAAARELLPLHACLPLLDRWGPCICCCSLCRKGLLTRPLCGISVGLQPLQWHACWHHEPWCPSLPSRSRSGLHQKCAAQSASNGLVSKEAQWMVGPVPAAGPQSSGRLLGLSAPIVPFALAAQRRLPAKDVRCAMHRPLPLKAGL